MYYYLMNKILTKKVSLLLLVIWLLVIFIFSSMNGGSSSSLSKNILMGLTNNSVASKHTFDLLHLILRKSAHFLEYFILSALIYNYLRFYNFKQNSLYILVFIFNLICSILDELHQVLTLGRTGKLVDVLIDSLGAILFLIIIIIVNKNATKRKSN